jgi:hypothetical protein
VNDYTYTNCKNAFLKRKESQVFLKIIPQSFQVPLTLLIAELCGLIVERRLHKTIALHVGLDGRQLLKPKINIKSIFS